MITTNMRLTSYSFSLSFLTLRGERDGMAWEECEGVWQHCGGEGHHKEGQVSVLHVCDRVEDFFFFHFRVHWSKLYVGLYMLYI